MNSLRANRLDGYDKTFNGYYDLTVNIIATYSFILIVECCCRNVLSADQAADPEALDVAHGVPPPRAAPALLRRVVLSETSSIYVSPSALPGCLKCHPRSAFEDTDLVNKIKNTKQPLIEVPKPTGLKPLEHIDDQSNSGLMQIHTN
jgi:hypothetical protein